MNYHKLLEGVELRHSTPFRVRYADTDKMGIVYNGNYLAFFETGRTELMRAYDMIYVNLESQGYLLPLVEAGVKYLKTATYDDLLTIEAVLKPEYKPTLTFEYNIFLDETTIAKGFTKHCFADAKTLKSRKPPAIFWDAIIEKVGSAEKSR